MLMKEARDAQYQRKATDNLQPLGRRCEQLFRSRMRNVVLGRKDQPGDHRNEERNLAAEKDHLRSLKRSRKRCGHFAPVRTARVASAVPAAITLKMNALPISWPRSVPIWIGSLER